MVNLFLEDFAYILDYLPQGQLDNRRFKRGPVAYALGDSEFKIFELTPKTGAQVTVGDRVYIGKEMEKREKILHVKRRIGYNSLTSAAQHELPFIIEKIISQNMERFLKFYNEAGAITTRFHMLELLPGLGKKTMWAILGGRKKGNFKSFKELEERVKIHHPEKLITKRIIIELSDPNQKYHIFVAK